MEGQASGGQAVDDDGNPEDGHHLSLSTAGSDQSLVEVPGDQRAGGEEGAVRRAHHSRGDDTNTWERRDNERGGRRVSSLLTDPRDVGRSEIL